MKKRVYYHDTDCGGVIYYANYLKYFEEARTEYFEERGISIRELVENDILFVVTKQEVEYLKSAKYGDIIDIETEIVNISGARIVFEYKIKDQKGFVIVNGKTILGCVNKELKPRLIPREIRDVLKHW